MKDALGNDLIIGQTYGYSRSENGITTVKVGKLVKITDKQVSLEILESKTALYSGDLKDRKPGRNISVKANGLFPVYTELLSQIKKLSNLWEECQSSGDLQDNLEAIHDLLNEKVPHIQLPTED
jgi:hypothetical protein